MLKEIASVIHRKLRSTKSEERTFISFVKEGEKPNKAVPTTSGVLDLTKDWVLKVDIHKKLVIPENAKVIERSRPWWERLKDSCKKLK